MTHWIRYKYENNESFGSVDGDVITKYMGDMFSNPEKSQETVSINDVDILTPCQPSKIIGLWNNFHATAQKNNMDIPEHPWYFIKTSNTYAATKSVVKRPSNYNGKILFEGELGIVIGKACNQVSVDNIADYIFGYTLVNDVTAIEYLFKEKSFEHWSRAKCFDGSGIFGPVIATDLNLDDLSLQTYLVGEQRQTRQDYPVSDMIFSPLQATSLISQDMTLQPGDIISCGTSLGAGAMKAGWNVEITVNGIGTLTNSYQD